MANKEDIQRFLRIAGLLESSGGTNTKHKTIESGLHAGDAAQGTYGMMPNTMEELQKRYPNSLGERSSTDDYANKMAELVLNRAKGDEKLAAALWHEGHNTAPEKFDEIKSKSYAEKYDKIRRQTPEALDPNPYYNKLDPSDFAGIKKLLEKK